MRIAACGIMVAGWLSAMAIAGDDASNPVGKRPYELDWAGRTHEAHPPLVDFEDLAGWKAEPHDAVATFRGTREQQIWDQHVGRLVYRAAGPSPDVRVVPPKPVPISTPFDTVTIWVYGNNWGYAPDPKTPAVQVVALCRDSAGQPFEVTLGSVDWTEWSLLHRRLEPAEIGRVRHGGASFEGLSIRNGRNTEDRTIYVDNLAVFVEELPPLRFEPRPARGIAMLPGGDSGTNTGPGKLPFPTRPETILPANKNADFRTRIVEDRGGFNLSYEGPDGRLVYRIEPRTGTWGDIQAHWTDGRRDATFRPCEGGGVWLAGPADAVPPEHAQHLGTEIRGDVVDSRWSLKGKNVAQDITYRYRIWNKSLVIDVLAPGGNVAEVRFGRAVGLAEPRLVTIPFYPLHGGRPAVVVSGAESSPLFVAGNADWYLSDASTLWAANDTSDAGVLYNGGSRYVARADGRRNGCFERFFVSVSPTFEETLPTIANPVSPWKHVTGTHLWRAHGASNREQDVAFWADCRRWGMTQVVVTDHETGWRDGGESFTFRTKPAPGKGGDKGQFDYARTMQDTLGFVYGPYNNFTDFAPVNEFWTPDLISRDPQNQLQHAWMRCYAPKPARAVEFCARLAPEIQKKFHFSTAYCDVHTAVAPWDRVDFDPRVPGAGTFAAVYYAFGEIMLLQKKAWDGPVYSEGNHHAFYAGLTDGNYGQDQAYLPAENPWLVDFDLRKMHDLCCNFGMGNPEMFYANRPQPSRTAEERAAWLDRFLAATVAFGHPGFLAYEGGLPAALESYYMLQQLHSRYCLATAREIRYADASGLLLDTSAAVATGAHRRSQVVTRYEDGTVTAANGSRTDRMKVADAFGHPIDLPPNGYAGWSGDGSVVVLSADRGGHRFSESTSPAYLYVNGRGTFHRGVRAAGNGIGICRTLPDGSHEVLLHEGAECGFAIAASSANAFDREGKPLGSATLRHARGLVYVVPVPGAFRYVLTGGTAEADSLRCDRDEVHTGERLVVQGRERHEVTIPRDAKPGQRLWIDLEGASIDFTVVPVADVSATLEGRSLRVALASHAASKASFRVQAMGSSKTIELTPGGEGVVAIDLETPKAEGVQPLELVVQAEGAEARRTYSARVTLQQRLIASLGEPTARGIIPRGGGRRSDMSGTGAIVETRSSIACGGVSKPGLFMHPPYAGGPGLAFATLPPVTLPAGEPAAFRAFVGKQDGGDQGDGILYRLVVRDDAGRSTVAAETLVKTYAWQPFQADLSRWAGRRVSLELIADPGPHDDTTADWGCWAEMRLTTLATSLAYDLESSK